MKDEHNFKIKKTTAVLHRNDAFNKLRESEERFRELFTANKVVELIIDPDSGQIIDANQAAENFYGYSREEMLRLNIDNINTLSKDQIKAEMNLAKAEKRDHFIFKHRLANDDIRNVEVHSGPIHWNQKNRLYSIIHDISDRILAEKLLVESEVKFRGVFNQAAVGVARLAPDGVWLEVNNKLCDIVGYSAEELLTKTFQDITHPDDLTTDLTYVNQLLNDKIKTYSMEKRYIKKNGHIIWINLTVSLMRDKNNKPDYFISIVEDITERKLTRKELEISKNKLSDLLDSLSVGVVVHAPDTSIIMHNPKAAKTLGLTSDQLKGLTAIDSRWRFTDGNKNILLAEEYPVNKIIATKEPITNRLFGIFQPKNIDITWVHVNGFPILNNNNEVTEIVINFIDITELKNKDEKLSTQYNLMQEQKDTLDYQAHHDELTGLPNRILFNDRLEQAIETAELKKTQVALLFIDLDSFKEINDSVGHHVGDEVLKIVSKRLTSVIRDKDIIARLGGDEFTVIVEKLIQAQDASLIANKILDTLSREIVIDDNTFYVSSSIGISMYPVDGTSTQELLKFADSAMYKAKDEGRNNFQYYNAEMTTLAFERVVMGSRLRAGLKNKEFVVYYQPQIDVVTDKLVGMEALVRWQHPGMGLIPPFKFIPLAESTGLIVELDRQVMRIAMIQLSQWYKDGLNPGVLALNLAIKQLAMKDFIETLENLIDETQCKPEWIELEVTEGQIMKNPEEAIKLLQQISDIGIKLAVDDFGTGYSSLAYLKHLPINKLKIDQSFVRHLPEDKDDKGIVKSIISLTQNLELSVIAEGVETQGQKDFLVENGCRNIQGYFYSKPLPSNEMEKYLMGEISC